jgi:hypothetical protein
MWPMRKMACCCRRDTVGARLHVGRKQPIIAMNRYVGRRYQGTVTPSGNQGHEREFWTRTPGSDRHALSIIAISPAPWSVLRWGALFLAVFASNVVLAIFAWFVVEWAMRLVRVALA